MRKILAWLAEWQLKKDKARVKPRPKQLTPQEKARPARRPTPAEMSEKLQYDVRDLFAVGYSMEQVEGAYRGDYTLKELQKMKPDRSASKPVNRIHEKYYR